MTGKMATWQIDKVKKMQDLSEELMTGINDSLDYMLFNTDMVFDPNELIIMEAFVGMCAHNIDMCGNVLGYLEKWKNWMLWNESKSENNNDSIMK